MKRLLISLAVALCSVAHSQTEPSDALQRLSSVKIFAFGGTGFAGRTSQGEKDFRIIVSQPRQVALENFEAIYNHGTPEAKSYALAGIRKIDAQRFKALLQSSHSSKEKVHTMEGCIVEDRAFIEVAKTIDSGSYDTWLNSNRP